MLCLNLDQEKLSIHYIKMKNIKVGELKEGDLFCYSLVPSKREAFLVLEVKTTQIVCVSKNDTLKREVRKQRKGNCILIKSNG